MIALTSLTGYLHLGDSFNPATHIGLPSTIDLLRGLPVRSVPGGSSPYVVDMRFQLSMAAVHRLEAARHASPDDAFLLSIRFEGPLVWLHHTYGEARVSPRQPVMTDEDDPFQAQLGLHSMFSHFWTTDFDRLNLAVESSVWISKVLPGLGIDHVRLLEVAFPPGLPDIGNAAKAFDEAQRAFHARRYEDCIGKCRGIIQAWNKQLSATKQQHLSQIVGDRLRWPADDPRRKILDALWQSLLDAGNAPHHPDVLDALYQPTAHDARLHLMMTAVISEYLYQVLR